MNVRNLQGKAQYGMEFSKGTKRSKICKERYRTVQKMEGTEYARKGKEKYGLGKESADKCKELLAYLCTV